MGNWYDESAGDMFRPISGGGAPGAMSGMSDRQFARVTGRTPGRAPWELIEQAKDAEKAQIAWEASNQVTEDIRRMKELKKLQESGKLLGPWAKKALRVMPWLGLGASLFEGGPVQAATDYVGIPTLEAGAGSGYVPENYGVYDPGAGAFVNGHPNAAYLK